MEGILASIVALCGTGFCSGLRVSIEIMVFWTRLQWKYTVIARGLLLKGFLRLASRIMVFWGGCAVAEYGYSASL